MVKFHRGLSNHPWWWGLRQIALHVVITLLALGIAFSLPVIAQYVLYQWWPLVASDTSLLLSLEISLAASLVVLFNMWRAAAENRRKSRIADTAVLVHGSPRRRLVEPPPRARLDPEDARGA